MIAMWIAVRPTAHLIFSKLLLFNEVIHGNLLTKMSNEQWSECPAIEEKKEKKYRLTSPSREQPNLHGPQ